MQYKAKQIVREEREKKIADQFKTIASTHNWSKDRLVWCYISIWIRAKNNEQWIYTLQRTIVDTHIHIWHCGQQKNKTICKIYIIFSRNMLLLRCAVLWFKDFNYCVQSIRFISAYGSLGNFDSSRLNVCCALFDALKLIAPVYARKTNVFSCN